MPYYDIRIKETLVKVVEIDAENADEAIRIATDLHADENIRLDLSDYDDVEIEMVE